MANDLQERRELRKLTGCCGVCRRSGGVCRRAGQMNRRALGGCEGGIDR